MRGLALIMVVALGLVGFLYFRQTGGLPSDGGGLTSLLNIFKGVGSGAAGAAKPTWDNLASQPWFYTAAVSGALATLGVVTWRRIGGWGRGFVLVCATIAAVTLVVRFA